MINAKNRVLMVEDPVTSLYGLPRSPVPHCLDDLMNAPLAFLRQTGYRVDPLPVRMPIRRDIDPAELRGRYIPELTFTEQARFSPFFISMDISYFDFSNIPHLADGRQSIVLWYAGASRGCLPKSVRPRRRLAHFMPLQDAVALIQAQPQYDVVAVRALRLFKKILEAAQPIPRDLGAPAPPAPEERAATCDANVEGTPCYPASMMFDPVYPVPTPTTTAIVRYSCWSAADFIVRTGVVVLDKQRNLVLMASSAKADVPLSLPRFIDDDAGKLLCHPLGNLESTCSRLALPRMCKWYRYVDGSDKPRADTVVRGGVTTNPFFVTFKSWWDHKGKTISKSLGRQDITFWFAGSFNATLGVPEGFVAVPVHDARDKLDTTDAAAYAALNLCMDLEAKTQDVTQ